MPLNTMIDQLTQHREEAVKVGTKIALSFDLVCFHSAHAEEVGATRTLEAIRGELAVIDKLLTETRGEWPAVATSECRLCGRPTNRTIRVCNLCRSKTDE